MTRLIFSSDLPAPVPTVFRYCTSSSGFEQLFPYRVRWRTALENWSKGDLLHFRYRLGPGLWLTHRARVVEFQENVRFVDEMAGGPFRLFRHVHLFEPTPDGGTRVIDHLQVTTRFGPLVDRLVCRVMLLSTFRQRHEALGAHFAPAAGSDTGSDAAGGDRGGGDRGGGGRVSGGGPAARPGPMDVTRGEA